MAKTGQAHVLLCEPECTIMNIAGESNNDMQRLSGNIENACIENSSRSELASAMSGAHYD